MLDIILFTVLPFKNYILMMTWNVLRKFLITGMYDIRLLYRINTKNYCYCLMLSIFFFSLYTWCGVIVSHLVQSRIKIDVTPIIDRLLLIQVTLLAGKDCRRPIGAVTPPQIRADLRRQQSSAIAKKLPSREFPWPGKPINGIFCSSIALLASQVCSNLRLGDGLDGTCSSFPTKGCNLYRRIDF